MMKTWLSELSGTGEREGSVTGRSASVTEHTKRTTSNFTQLFLNVVRPLAATRNASSNIYSTKKQYSTMPNHQGDSSSAASYEAAKPIVAALAMMKKPITMSNTGCLTILNTEGLYTPASMAVDAIKRPGFWALPRLATVLATSEDGGVFVELDDVFLWLCPPVPPSADLAKPTCASASSSEPAESKPVLTSAHSTAGGNDSSATFL
mmetsp:Transcript_45363/g.125895  ORF Transcript_45363/g.125895 Transcript_45363/m.125895 type:complete len:207 (-) Transcript_45363:259-879(-)